MECISEKMLQRISLMEEYLVDWMPESDDGYDYEGSNYYDHFLQKLFYLSLLTLYKELGLIDDFTLKATDCCFIERDRSGNYPSDIIFQEYCEDSSFSIRYEFQLSFRDWNISYILPIFEKLGWTVLEGDECMDILNTIEGVNLDEDYTPLYMEDWLPIVVYSEKWKNYFNELHKYPELKGSSEFTKLFSAANFDFFSVFFYGDEPQNAQMGFMFHNMGISTDGAELLHEAISPIFPLRVLKTEYYMWKLAKNHPETGLLQIMESENHQESGIMDITKTA